MLEPADGERDLFRPALAAALAALDMIRTGPSAETGEADADEVAEMEVWLEVDAAEPGMSCSALLSSREAMEDVATGFTIDGAVALFWMSRLSSDTLETRETVEVPLATARSGEAGGASDAIRTEGLH